MRNAMMSVLTAVVLSSSPAWAEIVPVFAGQVADVCLGDLNGDEVVDSADLASILGSYGICKGCDEDLNHDGYVDETDVKILALRFGPCTPYSDAIEKSVRTAADVNDDPDIFEGDVSTDGDAFSDAQQAACEGDLDRNGQVDSTDLAMLLGKHGQCKKCEEDLNGDGFVDEEDVDILLDMWGKCAGDEETLKTASRSLAATEGMQTDEDSPTQNEPEEEEPQCPGDLDGNGTIDSTDMAMLLARYGRCDGCEADLTGDGYVDRDDIDEMMASWGDCDAEAFSDARSKGKGQLGSSRGG